MKKLALVTGAQGFIGSHLCEALAHRGYTIRTFDLKDGQSITDKKAVECGLMEADVVFNLAGILGTDELTDVPYEAIDANITGMLNVLEAARKHDFDVVQIGKPNVWNNIYSITKRASEDLTLFYHQVHSVDARVVKLYNVFGPRQHYGKPKKLAPTAIVHALLNDDIVIFGDGKQTADHIYVKDAVQAIIDIYENSSAIGKTIEVGSGIDLTVNEFVKMIIKYTDSTSNIEYIPMRRGEDSGAKIKANTKLLKNTIKFHCRYNLDEGLKETIDWYKDNLTAVLDGKY